MLSAGALLGAIILILGLGVFIRHWWNDEMHKRIDLEERRKRK